MRIVSSQRSHLPCLLAAFLAAVVAACSSTSVARVESTQTPSASKLASAAEPSLYTRLGGYDAISAVVDTFAQRLFEDPVVGKRFFGMSTDSRENFRQMNKNLVCNVTGGPCKVISRPAKKAHAGLGIKASEFDIVVNHLVATLDSFRVPEKEKTELLAIIGSLRADIVEVEGK